MVWRVGPSSLLDIFHAIGLWLVPYVLLEVIPVVLHSAGWAACFPGQRLPVKLWRLVLVGKAGNAINYLLPTATIGGEVVKVLMLEVAMPREQAMAMVVIDKASSTIARMLYLTLGMLYLTHHLPLPVELQLSLKLTIGLISLGLLGFVAFQRYGLLSQFVCSLERLRLGQKHLQRLRPCLVPLDAQLVTYYTRYPWRFVHSLLLHFTAQTFRVIQTYVLLHFLLGNSAPAFTQTIMVTVAVSALDQMFFFVPGHLGTLEGARFLVLTTLGVAHVYGLAFGLIERVEQLVWSGLGLLAYAVYARLSPSTVRDNTLRRSAGTQANPYHPDLVYREEERTAWKQRTLTSALSSPPTRKNRPLVRLLMALKPSWTKPAPTATKSWSSTMAHKTKQP
jgi:uncharacterized membrane protein YbhN (UPF0104 family)